MRPVGVTQLHANLRSGVFAVFQEILRNIDLEPLDFTRKGGVIVFQGADQAVGLDAQNFGMSLPI